MSIGVLGGCGSDSEQDGTERNVGGSETLASGTGGAVASTIGGSAGATDGGDTSSGGTGDTPGAGAGSGGKGAGSGGKGGSAAGPPSTSGGAGAGSGGTGGSTGGTAGTMGGAGASSGGTDGGTGATAGSSGYGGSCRSVSDCPPDMMSTTTIIWSCVAPYQRPPVSVGATGGAPSWCGAANCDPPPPEPLGSGTTCQSEADCPAPSSDGDPVAAQCYLEECTECGTNAHCPAARPVCIRVHGPPDDYDYQACVECTSTTDCADGVCSKTNLTCVPQCEAPSDCPDPANPCSSHLRCEPQDCVDSSTCPSHTTCRSGQCLRIPCSSDADCTDGFCVNGGCYEDLGICASQTIYA